MFFIDKYEPQKIDDMHFNDDVLKRLKIMSEDDSVPHIIFYGPNGCGKKTIIKLFLSMLYDNSVHELVNTEYNVIGSCNNNTKVTVKQSNYHIVIEPNNNNFDRYLIQDVVKEYAIRTPVNFFMATRKTFKTVLINNVDNLSYYAQTSLRRTLEKYSDRCRFIMWSRSLSKVINPLRSRCYCFKIKSPSNKKIMGLLLDVCSKEQIHMTLDDYNTILQKSQRNVKKALWLLELHKYGINLDATYDTILDMIVKKILKKNPSSLFTIRELLYKIMTTNIDGSYIIKNILNRIITDDNLSDECKYNIIELAAIYEFNLIRGRREIMHLEAFIVSIMGVI